MIQLNHAPGSTKQPEERTLMTTQDKSVKVVDYFNGWYTRSMTQAEAELYIATHYAPTPRGIEPASAKWRFDERFSEWAWFDGEKRIS